MIQDVTMYQAVCDRCGRICASMGGIIAWTDTESAKYVALESGWKEINGNLYCPDCVECDEGTNSYKPKGKEDER